MDKIKLVFIKVIFWFVILYLHNRFDLIPDAIPLAGMLDDSALIILYSVVEVYLSKRQEV